MNYKIERVRECKTQFRGKEAVLLQKAIPFFDQKPVLFSQLAYIYSFGCRWGRRVQSQGQKENGDASDQYPTYNRHLIKATCRNLCSEPLVDIHLCTDLSSAIDSL